MDIQPGAIDRVLEDCVHVLKAIRTEQESDRKPYAVDLRRLLESGLVLRFGEYLQFLEKYGFLKLDRRSDLLNLTRPGKELIEGKLSRSDSLKADATHHFGERLNEVVLTASTEAGPSEPLDGRYLVHFELGSGALSTVKLGVQLSLNKPVAIKEFTGLAGLAGGEITPLMRRDLRRTIEQNAQIDSPFVLSVLDMNVDADVPYAVTELCAGGNLRSLMDGQQLEFKIALSIFRQMVIGLNAAHTNGMVHGDLKPENILITSRGNVKIADLGFSKLAQSDTASQQRAYVGYASLGYLAPEMFRQDRTYTVGSDIYALGIILYELLVGRLPGRRSPLPSQIVEGLPEGIDDLFDTMADDDHASRVAALDVVLERLDGILELENSSSRAELFLVPPFELPVEISVPVIPQAQKDSPALLKEPKDEKQTQNIGELMADGFEDPEAEAKGLETINSASLVQGDDVEEAFTAVNAEGSAGESEPVDDGEEQIQPDEPVAEVDAEVSGDDDGPKLEPLPNAELSLSLDSRSRTEVSGADQTSVLDSIIED